MRENIRSIRLRDPAFANGGGDFYVIDLGSEDRGSVRRFRIDEQEHPIEFPPLGRMLETVLTAYRSGVFFVNSEGYLDLDQEAYASIAREINPGVAWWE